MSEIIRYDVNDQWAHSGMVEAGDFLFMSYCVGNIGQSIENQIFNIHILAMQWLSFVDSQLLPTTN